MGEPQEGVGGGGKLDMGEPQEGVGGGTNVTWVNHRKVGGGGGGGGGQTRHG